MEGSRDDDEDDDILTGKIKMVFMFSGVLYKVNIFVQTLEDTQIIKSSLLL